MATPPKKAAAAPAAEAAAPAAKGRGKLVPIVAGLVIACGGGGGWFYMQHKNAEAKTAPVPEKKKVPAFLPIDQFTVNITGGGGDRFLQVAFSLELADPKVSDELKQQMPVVRSRLLLLLSSKTAEDLGNLAGKHKLMSEILTEARAPLATSQLPGKGVDHVHFSSFVIQ